MKIILQKIRSKVCYCWMNKKRKEWKKKNKRLKKCVSRITIIETLPNDVYKKREYAKTLTKPKVPTILVVKDSRKQHVWPILARTVLREDDMDQQLMKMQDVRNSDRKVWNKLGGFLCVVFCSSKTKVLRDDVLAVKKRPFRRVRVHFRAAWWREEEKS